MSPCGSAARGVFAIQAPRSTIKADYCRHLRRHFPASCHSASRRLQCRYTAVSRLLLLGSQRRSSSSSRASFRDGLGSRAHERQTQAAQDSAPFAWSSTSLICRQVSKNDGHPQDHTAARFPCHSDVQTVHAHTTCSARGQRQSLLGAFAGLVRLNLSLRTGQLSQAVSPRMGHGSSNQGLC
jgi:hypothetical protein